jgi:hypothetical protein
MRPLSAEGFGPADLVRAADTRAAGCGWHRPKDRATAAPTNNPTAVAQTTVATANAFAPPRACIRAPLSNRPNR